MILLGEHYQRGSLVIPEGTEALGCSGPKVGHRDELKSVSLPDGLTRIGYEVFMDTSITEIVLPESLEIIDDRAFRNSKLESVRFPSKMGPESLGCGAFTLCKNLKEVVLPSGLEVIGERTFSACARLAKVVLPEGLEFIGCAAFSDVDITEIEIPASVTNIEQSAFYGCRKLKSIVLPEGITDIKKDTFARCESMRTAFLPSTIEQIDESAFLGCKDLTIVITGPADFKILSSEFFDDCDRPINNNVVILAPAGTTVTEGKGVIPLKEYYREGSDVFLIGVDSETIDTYMQHGRTESIVKSAQPIHFNDDGKREMASPEKLEDYLKALYESECQVMNMERALDRLLAINAAREDRINTTIEHASDICSIEIASLRRRAQGLRSGEIEAADIESIGKPPIPVAPPPTTKPERPTEPAVPDYQTPSFFNKKRVEKANEELRIGYEQKLEMYQRALERYGSDIRQYEAAQDNYEAYLSAKSNYNRARREAAEPEAKALEERAEKLFESKTAEMTVALEAYHAAFGQLVDEAQRALCDAAKTRAGLYAFDIIFPKYRNLPAISTFYEYIASGRCNTLEGPDGAYNLYESELRADRAIARLEDIANSIEQVKANQYMLYQAVQETNQAIENLTATVESVGNDVAAAVNKTTHELRDMQPKLDSLQQTSREIALNSAASAYWSRKNAELTNSIGYLVAFDALS